MSDLSDSSISRYVLSMQGASAAPPRRDQALAFIIEWTARNGTCPTYADISRRLKVSITRSKQLVNELVRAGIVEKTPGAHRGLRVRDVSHSRILLDEALRNLGWVAADPMGKLRQTFPEGQLPVLPDFEHLPDL